MKTITTLILLSLAMLAMPGLAQKNFSYTLKMYQYHSAQLDTRADNIGYWKNAAEKGLVPKEPFSVPPKAIYTGSQIRSRSVITTDSPDVPVTNLNSTQSENSIFVNPADKQNVLNSNNSTENPVGNLYGANDLYSFDGGDTWGGELEGSGGENSGDPVALISLDGRYYIGYIAINDGQGVSHSTDQGQTWTAVQVDNGGNLQDKNHLWVDNSLTSPYAGYVYDAWTDLAGNIGDYGDIYLSVSSNGGVSWSTRTNISDAVYAGSHNQGVNISTGPYGEVYAAWAIYDSWPSDEKAIGFNKSLDGGTSWQSAVRIIDNLKGIRTTETAKNQRVNSFPCMSVDISQGPRRGNIYIVWTNIGYPGVNIGSDIDVYMIKSTDLGATWSEPVRINQDPSGLGKQHYFPWITCDPATGTLSVIFYDDRNVYSDQCEVFCANSYDGGETWSDFKVSDVAFSPAPIPGLASGYFGDYLGISARGGKAYPAWTDNRTGTAMAYVSPFMTGLPPNAPMNPYPPNIEHQVLPFTVLRWQDGVGAGDTSTSYKVFLGTNDPPNNIINGQVSNDTTFIIPVDLQNETWYYWRIASQNDFGSAVGPVWSFKTTSPPSEDFETGDFSQNDWQFGGNAEWTIDDFIACNGIYSARSGVINEGEYSSLMIELQVISFGKIIFYKKISSEQNTNTLKFLIDNVIFDEWSGESDWTEESFIVSPGIYTFEWRYVKTSADSSGSDAVWIDYINFPPGPQLTVNAGFNDFSCEEAGFTLNGQASYYTSTLWTSPGDGTFDDPSLLNATYFSGSNDATNGSVFLTLTAYNLAGDSVSDNMKLTVNEKPDVYAGEAGQICEGETYTLSAATVANYVNFWWATSGDGTFNDPSFLNPTYMPGPQDIVGNGTTLTLTASGYPLCDTAHAGLFLNILSIPAVPDKPAGPDYVDLYHVTTSEFAIDSVPFATGYQWFLSPAEAGTISGSGITGIVAWYGSFLGIATVQVKAMGECGESTYSQSIEVVVDNSVGYSDLPNDQINLTIRPNPNNGKFTLEITSPALKIVNLKIVNSSGALMFEESNLIINQRLTRMIELNNLREGIYYINLENNGSLVSRKLLLLK
jgi:hypothetical protein